MAPRRRPQGGSGFLRGNILALGVTSLLTDISSESVYSVLPFYISDVLGYGKDIVGVVEGVGEAVSSIFKLIGGLAADRLKRYKKLALLGYSLSTVSKPFFAFSTHWLHVLAVRIADRIGKGIRAAPRDTLLSMSATKKTSGRAFGFHRAMDTLGALLAPLLAFMLLPVLGYRGVFLLSIVPGLLAVAVLAFLVREVYTVTSVKKETDKWSPSTGFYLFLASVSMAGLSGYVSAFLLLHAREAGWDSRAAVLLLSLANLVYATLAYPVGWMSDRLGAHRVYPAVFLVEAFATLSVTLLPLNPLYPPLFFILYGLYHGFRDTLIRVMVSVVAPTRARGKAYGYIHGFYGVSALMGSYIAGLLYQNYGYIYSFTYMLAMSMLGLVFSLLLTSNKYIVTE